MSVLIEHWRLITFAVYAASAAVGIGYSVANLFNSRHGLVGLRHWQSNGAALAVARGMVRTNMALLGCQLLEAVLFGVSLTAASSGGAPTARGVIFAAILIAMNLLISLASVATVNTWRRVRAYVAREGTAEAE